MIHKSYLYERRRQYRLHYPIAERPGLDVGDMHYSVAELSEGGMRVLYEGKHEVPEDFPFNGWITYRNGGRSRIQGKVLRSDEYGFSVQFLEGVGLRRIMSDQIRLKQKYPLMFT